MARITFNTMYNTTMRGLQNNANKLDRLHEQISSEQKINRPSDNPIDFTNVLRYGNTLDKLQQQSKNINDAEVYMTILENSHDKMNSIYGRCQALAVDLSNDTENHDQRLYGNLEVRQLLEELVALSQTRHKDGYVFSGKWSDQPPYEIKSGDAIWHDAQLTIPAKNFMDDPRLDPNDPSFSQKYSDVITATPQHPDYDKLRWHLTFLDTAPITISLLDGNYRDPNISMDTSLPPPNYTNEWRNPIVQRIIPGSVDLRGLEASGLKEKPQFDENGSPFDEYGIPYADYEIDYENGTLILLSAKAKAAFYDVDTLDAANNIADNGVAVRKDFNPATYNAAAPPGTPQYTPHNPRTPYNSATSVNHPDMSRLPKMSFDYIYRNSIDMSGDIYREIDTGITIKINADPNDLFGKAGLNDTDCFKEIISLMQGLWYNEQPQIANSIERIGDAAERNLAEQATEGARLNRLEIVKNRNDELKITNTGALSIIQDVDVAEALTQFSLAQAVYNASLYATSNLLQRSLMDYL